MTAVSLTLPARVLGSVRGGRPAVGRPDRVRPDSSRFETDAVNRLAQKILVALLAAAAGCNGRAAKQPTPGRRLVTYSPALTEMAFAMGLGDLVVGVTSQCDLPPGQKRTVVGDALNVSAEAVLAVRPDIVLTQVEAAKFAAVRAARPDAKIEHFRIETLDAIAEAVERMGRIAGRQAAGRRAAESFRKKLADLRGASPPTSRPRVLFVVGYEHPFAAGKGTFLHEMIELVGGTNAAAGLAGWKGINLEHVLALRPAVLVCQASAGQEGAARAYWQVLGDLPAVAGRRVFIVTDRHWTIPSTRMAALAAELAAFVRGPAGEGGRGDG